MILKLFNPKTTNQRLDYFESEKYCNELSGNLARFDSLEGTAIVVAATQLANESSATFFWIGFDRVDKNNYQWTDGSPVDFTNWWPGEPNNFNNNEQCAQIRRDGRWNDAACHSNLGWMCKINKGVNPTSNPIVVPPTFQGI